MKRILIHLAFTLVLCYLVSPVANAQVTATGTVINEHCYGDSMGSISYQINGGTGPIHYVWNNGDSGVSVSGCTYTVHITNVNSTLTGFQVLVPVNLTAGMNANFSNISFTDTLGNLLPFWLQDFPTATTGDFWVRIPTLPTGVTNIYMTFCDTASVAGNPAGTFEFFDNFDNNTFPLWTGACFNTGATCTYTATTTGPFSGTTSALLGGTATCYTAPYAGVRTQLSRTATPVANDTLVINYEDKAQVDDTYCCGNTSTTNSVQAAGVSQGNGQSIAHPNSGTSTTGWLPETSTPFVVTTGSVLVSLETGGGDCDISKGWFDDVRIRKYRTFEPTVVIDTTPRLMLDSLKAGLYVITMTTTTGSVFLDSFTVTQPNQVLPILDSTNVTCPGLSDGSAWVTSPIGGTAPYTYAWSGTTQTTDSVTGLAPGFYQVTVTDASGCSGSGAVNITQPAATVTVTADSINVACFGQSTGQAWAIATGGMPGYTYAWSPTSQTTDTITGLPAGNYTVIAADANHCTATTSVNITQPSSAVSLVMDSVNVLCYGQSTGSAWAIVSGGVPGYTYLWSDSRTTDTISSVPVATYSVVVTDANGCTINGSVNVTQPAAPLTLVMSKVDVLCYGMSTGQVSVAASGGTAGYTYLWNTTATTDTISALPSGPYTVTVTDAAGCTATATATVNQPNAALSVTMSETNITCRGLINGRAYAQPAGGTSPYSFLWSNSQTADSITGLNTGTYTVVVTDANGCTVNGSATIAPSNDSLQLDTSAKAAICGMPNGEVGVVVTGGSGTYQYDWSNGGNTATLTGVTGGTYFVSVTDASGCSGTGSVSIPEYPAITSSVTTHEDSCDAKRGYAVIMVNGSPPYVYNYTPVGTNPAALDSGVYFVTITDSLGCSITDTFIIENNNLNCGPILLFPTGFSPNNDGKNDIFHPIYSAELANFHMRIYDRWGQLVYETFDFTQGWDGMYRNVAQPMGVYIWFADFNFKGESPQTQTGNITLIR